MIKYALKILLTEYHKIFKVCQSFSTLCIKGLQKTSNFIILIFPGQGKSSSEIKDYLLTESQLRADNFPEWNTAAKEHGIFPISFKFSFCMQKVSSKPVV